jgi:hypothetical protein
MPLPIRTRLRDERGFSMGVVIMVMLAASVLVVTGLSAAQGDLHLSKNSENRKAAYAAAESGLHWYLSRLRQNDDFFALCTEVEPAGSPVNQRWDGSGTDPRTWKGLPASSARYTIELLPAAGKTACVAGDDTSMLDATSGTFRIRSSGEAGAGADKVRRSIVATFKRQSLLDFLYLTDYENRDPAVDNTEAKCANKYRTARAGQNCVEIQFITEDEVAGPFHTNDSILMCGTPSFGRNASDRVESSQSPGWVANPGCTPTTPTFKGTWDAPATPYNLPVTNSELINVAEAKYEFTGRTHIDLLADGKIQVKTDLDNKTQTLDPPPNGVIYVKQASCSGYVKPQDTTYNESAGCAVAYVRGTYKKNLTIASAGDIVVGKPTAANAGGNLERSGDVMLGLIAFNYVRVYHPVNNCANTASMSNLTVQAAILALAHSFTVDNYDAGAKLGKLTVEGAIAQKYRGPVGTTGGGCGQTGYIKNYQYDNRLRFRSPPYFLEPVAAAWRVGRVNEQIPAR